MNHTFMIYCRTPGIQHFFWRRSTNHTQFLWCEHIQVTHRDWYTKIILLLLFIFNFRYNFLFQFMRFYLSGIVCLIVAVCIQISNVRRGVFFTVWCLTTFRPSRLTLCRCVLWMWLTAKKRDEGRERERERSFLRKNSFNFPIMSVLLPFRLHSIFVAAKIRE